MNDRMKTFATLVASGSKPQQAYAEAYPDASASMRRVKPYVLLKNPGVKALIEALQKSDHAALRLELQMKEDESLKALREVGLSRAEKRRILKRIAENPKNGPFARIRAIQVDNEMTGDNAPVRVEGEITLHTIFQALASSTGLPSEQEVLEAETYDPNGPK